METCRFFAIAKEQPIPQFGNGQSSQVPDPQTPHERRPARPGPAISMRSSGCRKKHWPSRTRSSAQTFAWSFRSPKGIVLVKERECATDRTTRIVVTLTP